MPLIKIRVFVIFIYILFNIVCISCTNKLFYSLSAAFLMVVICIWSFSVKAFFLFNYYENSIVLLALYTNWYTYYFFFYSVRFIFYYWIGIFGKHNIYFLCHSIYWTVKSNIKLKLNLTLYIIIFSRYKHLIFTSLSRLCLIFILKLF